MSDTSQYTRVCHKHKAHDDDCPHCRAFDLSLRQLLATYIQPLHLHPSVVAIQVRQWIDSIFQEET